ncbi:MAG: hypothetical protein ACREQ4_14650 [Candidatus Binataceae bacterium]
MIDAERNSRSGWLASVAGILIALLIIVAVNVGIRYTGVYYTARQFAHDNHAIGVRLGSVGTVIFAMPVFISYGARTADYYKRARLVLLVTGASENGLLYLDVDQHKQDWVVSAATVCQLFACDKLPLPQSDPVATTDPPSPPGTVLRNQ